mmetsp:Transcript_15777/g.31724  ORF Transcript_15777/g.31724 Transcript_15777/m.31724 type:complete len:231 (-) Transcript_15777:146-838(-)
MARPKRGRHQRRSCQTDRRRRCRRRPRRRRPERSCIGSGPLRVLLCSWLAPRRGPAPEAQSRSEAPLTTDRCRHGRCAQAFRAAAAPPQEAGQHMRLELCRAEPPAASNAAGHRPQRWVRWPLVVAPPPAGLMPPSSGSVNRRQLWLALPRLVATRPAAVADGDVGSHPTTAEGQELEGSRPPLALRPHRCREAPPPAVEPLRSSSTHRRRLRRRPQAAADGGGATCCLP